jgi:hypothetical protein
VQTGDLDEVLGGKLNLIFDEQTSIMDLEDKEDIMVDYEQFSKMLLGVVVCHLSLPTSTAPVEVRTIEPNYRRNVAAALHSGSLGHLHKI